MVLWIYYLNCKFSNICNTSNVIPISLKVITKIIRIYKNIDFHRLRCDSLLGTTIGGADGRMHQILLKTSKVVTCLAPAFKNYLNNYLEIAKPILIKRENFVDSCWTWSSRQLAAFIRCTKYNLWTKSLQSILASRLCNYLDTRCALESLLPQRISKILSCTQFDCNLVLIALVYLK